MSPFHSTWLDFAGAGQGKVPLVHGPTAPRTPLPQHPFSLFPLLEGALQQQLYFPLSLLSFHLL